MNTRKAGPHHGDEEEPIIDPPVYDRDDLDDQTVVNIPRDDGSKLGGMDSTIQLQSAGTGSAFDSAPLVPGYTMLEPIGKGGMGMVWKAEQASTKRQVAVKFMHDRAFTTDRHRDRFLREVELAAKIEHPNIARIYDSGSHAGLLYYAMAFLDGQELDTYVADNKLTHDEIVALFAKVCSGVEAAHQKGVIHRDLKPGNVIVTPDGEPHILDFGLAKSLLDGDEDLNLTREGEIAGTPAYMAPEQAACHTEEIDTRTDVYTLGVILFKLLTGNNPHDLSGSSIQVIQRIAAGEVTRPRTALPSLDRELEAILLKTLAHQPGERYSSAGLLAEDLRRFLNNDPLLARPATAAYFLKKRLRKNLPLVLGAITLGLAAAAGIIFYIFSINAERQRTESQRVMAVQHAEEANRNAEQAEANADMAKKNAEESKANELQALRMSEEAQQNHYYSLVTAARTAFQLGSPGEALDHLKRCPTHLRNWEWYHLHRQCQMEASGVRIPNMGANVFFSHDAAYLYGISRKGEIRVWETENLQKILDYAEHGRPVGWRLAVHPSAPLVATFDSEGHIHIWTPKNGKTLHRLRVPGRPREVAFSPKGDTLAAVVEGKGVVFWKVVSGEQTGMLPANAGRGLKYFNDGKRLAVGVKDVGIAIYRLDEDYPRLKTLPGNDVNRFAISPDDRTIYTIANWGTLTAVDLESESVLWQREAGTFAESYTDMALSRDGRHILTAFWKKIELRDARTGDVVKKYREASGHNYHGVEFSPDGKWAAVGNADGFKLWDLQEPPEHTRPIPWLTVKGYIRGAALSPDERLLAVQDQIETQVIDLVSGERRHRIQKNDYHGHGGASFTPDGEFLFVLVGDKAIAKVRVDNGSEVWRKGPITSDKITRLQVAPTGSVCLVNYRYKKVLAFSTVDGEVLWEKSKAGNTATLHPLRPVFYADDNERTLHEYDLRSGEELRNLGPYRGLDDITVGAVNPAGNRLLSGHSGAGLICMWDLEAGELMYRRHHHDVHINAIAWLPDGSRVASVEAHPGRLILWAPEIGYPVYEALSGRVRALFFSQQGRQLISVGGNGENAIKFWDGVASQ